jgi:hypothetical protein
MDGSGYQKAIKLLESDIPKHLVTLKYLTLYKKNAGVEIAGDGKRWAVLSFFPTSILSFDREAYPRAKVASFVNGNDDTLKIQLLHNLPKNSYVLRLNAPLDLSGLEQRFKTSRGFTYLSYTSNILPAMSQLVTVPARSDLTPEAIALFKQNDYSKEELKGYFSHGARWFGYTVDDEIKSWCFVYHDYANFREIGGVRTIEMERQKGYGRIVVYSALKYLLDNGLVPRYCTEEKNFNSIRLAGNLGMKQFLRIEHFLIEPK